MSWLLVVTIWGVCQGGVIEFKTCANGADGMGTDNVSITVAEVPTGVKSWTLNTKITYPAGDYGNGITKRVYVYGR